MTSAFEERDREERVAVYLQEVERGEDLPASELPRIRVAVLVDFKVALVLPVGHQNTVEDGGLAPRLGNDRVVQLTRPVHGALVSDEMRLGVTNTHEHPRARPRRLEDVALLLRSLADGPGSLRQQICPEYGAQASSIPALDMANVRSIMRTPVRN